MRVRAQVMMREDSTGGWVPLGGGGLSHVAVRKRKIHHEDDPPCKHEYLIYGKRINDQKVIYITMNLILYISPPFINLGITKGFCLQIKITMYTIAKIKKHTERGP